MLSLVKSVLLARPALHHCMRGITRTRPAPVASYRQIAMFEGRAKSKRERSRESNEVLDARIESSRSHAESVMRQDMLTIHGVRMISDQRLESLCFISIVGCSQASSVLLAYVVISVYLAKIMRL